ncbi:hypothetical protein P167DRAFT_533089, partial [Morchella conica CCBAS932]
MPTYCLLVIAVHLSMMMMGYSRALYSRDTCAYTPYYTLRFMYYDFPRLCSTPSLPPFLPSFLAIGSRDRGEKYKY